MQNNLHNVQAFGPNCTDQCSEWVSKHEFMQQLKPERTEWCRNIGIQLLIWSAYRRHRCQLIPSRLHHSFARATTISKWRFVVCRLFYRCLMDSETLPRAFGPSLFSQLGDNTSWILLREAAGQAYGKCSCREGSIVTVYDRSAMNQSTLTLQSSEIEY